MCGRFALDGTAEDMVEAFGIITPEMFAPRFNIAPTQPILGVVSGPRREPGSNLPDRQAVLLRWGFIPAWSKDPKSLPLLINARSETAAEKATFRNAMRHRRILIPATGFYEWKRAAKKTGQAYYIRPRDGGVVAFGGLMETWAEPGGSEIDTGAILTTDANAAIASIHDRMPVVIRPRDFARWLDCHSHEPRDVADLLRPVEPDFFEAIPVSDKVNKVANTGPDIQDRMAVVEPAPVTAGQPKPQKPAADDGQLKLL